MVLDLENKVGDKFGLEVRLDMLLQVLWETDGNISQRILNDRIMLERIASDVLPHNKLFDLIDRKMQQFFEGGLINRFMIADLRILDKNRFRKFEDPFKILNLEELEAGFVISFAPLLLAVAAFGFEWLTVLKHFIIQKCIFEAFFTKHRDHPSTQ